MATPKVFFNMYLTTTQAENFRALGTGEKGIMKRVKPLHAKGSVSLRTHTCFMCQGADSTGGNGTGGESIYGSFFAIFSFTLNRSGLTMKHTSPGVSSLVNAGLNTYCSQIVFCYVLASSPYAKHVDVGSPRSW